ncbi:Bug family tripartite tricarboxylate transporter substrate binding protein [Ottowia sp. VDI28]|uniref:Bug family tripartite tricarboxylate transporter substrate binding protein n=1 Tax=Ottowia sp. VDI28 TaxID=3133968 RepID=UPI003C2B91B1
MGLLASASGAAQDFPTKPILLVVPAAAGGITDVAARIIADKMKDTLGQPLVVENVVGGNLTIGSRRVARANPDGYTFMAGTTTSHAAIQGLMKSVPYDPLADFKPVGMVGYAYQMLIISKTLPAANLKELVQYGKANPGKISFGAGSASARLAAASFGKAVGIEMQHVPYKANVQAVTDTAGGHIQLMFAEAQAMLPAVQDGRVRAIAVAGSARTPLAPSTPTLKELGVADVDMIPWMGFFAPAGVPDPIVDKLNHALRDAMVQKDVQEKLAGLGFEPANMTPRETRDFQVKEVAKWMAGLREAGIVPE